MSRFVWAITKPMVKVKGTLYMRKHFRRAGPKGNNWLASATSFVEDMALFKTKSEAMDFLLTKWQKHHDLDTKWTPRRRKWG